MRVLFTILFLILTSFGFSQTYFLKVDSLSSMTLKVGKRYTFKTADGKKTDRLKALNGDTFVFEFSEYDYHQIESIRNPKRNVVFDAITFPLAIGSCVAVSTIPITYVKGYFLADTDMMLRTVGFFIVETMVFSISRSYLSKNPKWIEIGSLGKLDWGEKS